jgi:hypothetical protein
MQDGKAPRRGDLFATSGNTYHHPDRDRAKDARHSYTDQADVFGVYCDELDRVYLVPVDAVPPRAQPSERNPLGTIKRRGYAGRAISDRVPG